MCHGMVTHTRAHINLQIINALGAVTEKADSGGD
jgi:hypothetical protein